MSRSTKVGLPPEVQHAALTRDDGEPSLTVDELLGIAVPTAPELGFAVRKGWIDAPQLAAILELKRSNGAGLATSETRLLANQTGSEQFAVEAGATKVPDVALESYWLYVFMTWAWRVRAQVPNPARVVEGIFIALDKPHQIAPFAWMTRRWAPSVGFLKSRRKAQLVAWRAYLDSEVEYFSDRAAFQRAR